MIYLKYSELVLGEEEGTTGTLQAAQPSHTSRELQTGDPGQASLVHA